MVGCSGSWVEANEQMSRIAFWFSWSESRPSLTARPSSVQNVAYFSGSFSCIALTVESTFLTRRLRISWIWRSCCRISREMLSDRSFASTTPLTKRRYSGTSASQSSMMNTRLT